MSERLPLTVIAARLIVAGVFLYAAVPKLADPAAFAEAIDNYHVLPASLVGPFAAILPLLEIVTACALVAGVGARGAAIVAGAMLLAFVVAMAQAMARGIDLECGCFGAETRAEVGWPAIGRNVLLIALCVLVAAAKDVRWRELPGRLRAGRAAK
jgi:uncharacterized membrane protein YphA (DoxX/SURF4 family)